MNDASQEPLIGADAEELGGEAQRTEALLIEDSELSTPSLFIWMLTVSAGISGLLFGYDTGVISSTLVGIRSDLSNRPLTTMDKSLITSCTSLFALLASPLAGFLADIWGRKRILLMADILFTFGALWQASTDSISGMIAGRSIVGVAVGSASFVAPLYISELSPSPFRGRLVTISCLLITGGQVVAYIIGWLFSTSSGGWRWMVGMGAVPAILQFIVLGFMPETPRWLVKANLGDKAKKVLLQVYGNNDEMNIVVDNILKRIEREMIEEDVMTGRRTSYDITDSDITTKFTKVSETFWDLVSIGGNRRALIIACALQMFQQLCGFNSLMYFSATIFARVGFQSPTLVSLTVAITNFLFTLIAFHSIDRIGRRRILLYSIPIMVIGLAICSIAFSHIDIRFDDIDLQSPNKETEDRPTWPRIVVIAMVTYVAGYAIGIGNVPWQQSELFPLPVRSLGSAVATATNWSSNTIIGLTFLPMMESLTATGTFAFYAIICMGSWVIIQQIYPETAGLGLEEVGTLLKNNWGVKESVRIHKQRFKFRETADSSLQSEPALTIASYIWCRPYLCLFPDHCLVLDDGQGHPVGYIIGTSNTEMYINRYRKDFFPSLDSDLFPSSVNDSRDLIRTLSTMVLHPEHMIKGKMEMLIKQYPAHFHIDILPAYQAKGYGRQLIKKFEGLAQDKGARGVYLTKSSGNISARGFYLRLGFTISETQEAEDSVCMVKEIIT